LSPSPLLAAASLVPMSALEMKASTLPLPESDGFVFQTSVPSGLLEEGGTSCVFVTWTTAPLVRLRMKISRLPSAFDSPGMPDLASETKAMMEASSLTAGQSLSSAKKGERPEAPARGTVEAGVNDDASIIA